MSELDTHDKCAAAEPRLVDGVPRPRLAPIGGGLYLQITPSKSGGATRSWIFRYGLHGREHRIGLGPLSRTNNLDRARIRALALREQVERKEDPKAARDQQRANRSVVKSKVTAKTFKDCAGEYITAHKKEWQSEAYLEQWKATLATYAYPILGDVPVADIDQAMVLRVLEPHWHQVTATMTKLRGRIAKVLGYAAAKGYRARGTNPAAWTDGLEHSLAKPSKISPTKHRAALDYRRMGEFMVELRKDERIAARALEFAILSATRTDEVRLARWQEIDLEERLWVVPKARMKMRGENREAHKVPLSEPAIAVLRALKGSDKRDPGELAFPGEGDDGDIAENAMLKAARRINPAITTHGFRTAFTNSAANQPGVDNETREFALAHVPKGSTAAYLSETSVDKRRVLLEQWAKHCQGNVVPLKRTA
jgi:integrase